MLLNKKNKEAFNSCLFNIFYIYLLYNIKTNNMKLTFEENSALIDVEATLKMLLTADNLKTYQKEWCVKSYKNIVNFRYQNE